MNGNNPPTIPDHEILSFIARGSYGEVWLARSIMGAHRAIKIVSRARFVDDVPYNSEWSGIQRFEPISRSHEGFLQILHVGINKEAAYFFYVMEVGDDVDAGQDFVPEKYQPKTLAQEIKRRGALSLHECLLLGLKLSEALHALHDNGLVHRDIKPANIIFVKGVPKLADIGLVTDVEKADTFVGTEGFIPPEGPGGIQADIYSLGKVLYEACTGKDRTEFPEFPDSLGTHPDRETFLELNEVILQACKNDRTERYQSAWDMHADLLRIMGGKSVREYVALKLLLARIKRVAAVSFLVIMAGGAIVYPIYRESRIAIEARQRRVGAAVAYGNIKLNSGNLTGSLPDFAEALRLDQGNEKLEAAHRLRLGSVLAQCPKLTHLWYLDKAAQDGGFSPDGREVVLPEFWGDATKIFDLENGNLVRTLPSEKGLATACFSHDGQSVLTGNGNNWAYLWDATRAVQSGHLAYSNMIFSARFNSNDTRVVIACADNSAQVWDVQTHSNLFRLLSHQDKVRYADFSHDGTLIATSSDDHTACVWDANDGRLLATLDKEHTRSVVYVAFSPNDRRIVTASEDQRAMVWERQPSGDYIMLHSLIHEDVVTSAEFSPDGEFIVTASFDGTVRLWSAKTFEPLKGNSILAHGARVTHAAVSPDSRLILTTCADGSVRVWDLAGALTAPSPNSYTWSPDGSRFLLFSNNCVDIHDAISGAQISITNAGTLGRLQFSRQGHFALSSTTNAHANKDSRLVQVWNTATGVAVAPGIELLAASAAVELDDSGNRLVVYQQKEAQLWDIAARTNISLPWVYSNKIAFVRFSPNGKLVAIASTNEVSIRDAVTGKQLFDPMPHKLAVSYVAFSRDGRLLATCCQDQLTTPGYTQIWDLQTGKAVGPPLPHADGVLCADFNADSTVVATSGEDFRALTWMVATGKSLGKPRRHQEQVQSIAFSPDGQRLLSASWDHSARVWDAETGDPLTPPLWHFHALSSAHFLPDGKHLLTTDRSGRNYLWELPQEERSVDDLIKLARLLSGDPINPENKSPAKSAERLDLLWKEMKAKYPANFVTTPQEVLAWHQYKADECEADKRWYGAAIHLKHLVLSRPGDSNLISRLNIALSHLHPAEPIAIR